MAAEARPETPVAASGVAPGNAPTVSSPTRPAHGPAATPDNARRPIPHTPSDATGEEAVEVTLDSGGDRPSWLQFDGSSVHISGLAPLTAEGGPLHLILRAKAGKGREGHLHLYVTRTTPTPALPAAPPPRPGSVPASHPPEPRCLVAILKGEPCP